MWALVLAIARRRAGAAARAAAPGGWLSAGSPRSRSGAPSPSPGRRSRGRRSTASSGCCSTSARCSSPRRLRTRACPRGRARARGRHRVVIGYGLEAGCCPGSSSSRGRRAPAAGSSSRSPTGTRRARSRPSASCCARGSPGTSAVGRCARRGRGGGACRSAGALHLVLARRACRGGRRALSYSWHSPHTGAAPSAAVRRPRAASGRGVAAPFARRGLARGLARRARAQGLIVLAAWWRSARRAALGSRRAGPRGRRGGGGRPRLRACRGGRRGGGRRRRAGDRRAGGAAERCGAHARRRAEAAGDGESNRYEYWRVGLDAFAREPLQGVGAGGYRVEWLRERYIAEVVGTCTRSRWRCGGAGPVGLLAFGVMLAGVAPRRAARPAGRPRCAAGPSAALARLDPARLDRLGLAVPGGHAPGGGDGRARSSRSRDGRARALRRPTGLSACARASARRAVRGVPLARERVEQAPGGEVLRLAAHDFLEHAVASARGRARSSDRRVQVGRSIRVEEARALVVAASALERGGDLP